VVDNFGIKVKGREHAEHLFAALRELYTITVDWTGSKYIVITIEINHDNCTVVFSMPGYLVQSLARFEITLNDLKTDSSLVYVPPTYCLSDRHFTKGDNSVPLSTADTNFVQQVVGVMSYYSRAIDPTMITAVHKIG
jgi:hypothetical protein